MVDWTVRGWPKAIPTLLWIAFCLLVGWAAAVLLLYGIGLVIDPLMIGAVVYVGWRWGLVPEAMLGFGAGVSLALVPFLADNLPYLREPLLVILAIGGLAAGPLISIAGAFLIIQRMRRST